MKAVLFSQDELNNGVPFVAIVSVDCWYDFLKMRIAFYFNYPAVLMVFIPQIWAWIEVDHLVMLHETKFAKERVSRMKGYFMFEFRKQPSHYEHYHPGLAKFFKAVS